MRPGASQCAVLVGGWAKVDLHGLKGEWRSGDLNALIPTLLGALPLGGTFIGMVSLVLSMARCYYPTRPAKMMGQMTLAKSAGG